MTHPTDTSEELRENEAIVREMMTAIDPDGFLTFVERKRRVQNALAAMSRARSTTGAVFQPMATAPKNRPFDGWLDVDGHLIRITDVEWRKSHHQCHSQYCDSCPKNMNRIGFRDTMSDEIHTIGGIGLVFWTEIPSRQFSTQSPTPREKP